jgi:hypothetical protein
MARSRRSSVTREIRGIRRSLASVARALPRLAVALEAAARDAAVVRPARGRKLRLSAARRTALKLQGQYMGHLRALKPRHKARVKRLRSTRGVRAAITLARRLAKG